MEGKSESKEEMVITVAKISYFCQFYKIYDLMNKQL